MLSDEWAKWKIASKPENKLLLIAVSCLAGLAIFFFGYDQGMMGGVNNSQAYVHRMGLGYEKDGSINITNTLLQGSLKSTILTFVGCFMGVLNATVSVYGSELADYETRGMFISMEFTLNIAGVVVAYWLGYGLSYVDNGTSELQWWLPIAFRIA
ncbi:hypothetical protein F1880_004817 [Penicillium rolfsii]|nr:hypothetical protein F1880_004817 [Penicillium rolfsii]